MPACRPLFIATLFVLPFLQNDVAAHDGPDPLLNLRFQANEFSNGILSARLGPDVRLVERPRPLQDDFGGVLYFSGRQGASPLILARDKWSDTLPQTQITVEAWVSIDQPLEWGGIVGAIQDNDDFEKGWLLGYRRDRFAFALASEGADDGNGDLTYLIADEPFEPGRLYHVVGIYDGSTMQLFVNGRPAGTSDEQSGNILYPAKGVPVVAGYQDSNENHGMRGTLRRITVYDRAAKPEWVHNEFAESAAMAELRPVGTQQGNLKLIVPPYLQFGTQTGMTVMWQSSAAANGQVYFGETDACRQQSEVTPSSRRGIHEHRLESLKPETQYFYQTVTTLPDGSFTESEVKTFVTAVREETPFAFAVMSDTQGNPKVSAEIASLAWAQRPSFLLHSGDLVSTGSNDSHWTQHFFPGVQELVSRVPFYSVLGNHEQNAANYFDYVSLPQPEYYYDFRYGNAHFFLVDTNRKVDPDSEQYQWLNETLAKSDAVWKFVCHHHPPYSSDENDYGNLWKTNESSRGDLRARQLVPLYEKYGVDIVWNGHIHSYERTWPLRAGKAVNKGGTIYMITGGAGGGLETAGPVRPWFQNNVRHGHHYVMVAINGRTLEFKAFTLDDRMFDSLRIEK